MQADPSADLELMRASMLLESNPAAAARGASGILARFPGHEEASLLLAAAGRRLGDPTRARELLESIAAQHPDSPVMQLELGRAFAAEGRAAEATRAFRRAIELDASFADGWRELAAQAFLAGDTTAGDVAFAKYSRLVPDGPELLEAGSALAENRPDAAAQVLKSRLARVPNDVGALRLLAEVASRRGERAEAERLLARCLELAPGHATARFDLARLLCAQQNVDAALPLIERLLAADPENASYLILKAQSIRFIGRSQEAIALLERVVAARPDDAGAWLVLGNLAREAGERERAVTAYRQALTVQPALGEAYWSLANLKTLAFTPADIEAMQRELAKSPALGANRVHLEFALGKAHEDLADYAASFQHYENGNALYRATINHDPDATADDVKRSVALYTPAFFAARSGWGLDSRAPIFIVGLPRSGSTLLEQILASHSAIEGTRELPYMPVIVQERVAQVSLEHGSNYPEPVGTLSREAVEALAALYLERTAAQRPLGRPRFVDKMLSNFGHVGLIHLMFPRAAIIDARRHPLACGFSCYKQLFTRGVNFSYDLEEVGRYYRCYADLMQHIDRVLPGRVHRVYYERLVADPEGEVRRLLDYCGLPFEEQCLRFYATERVVQTISSEQVRRPIYADAVEQWRHYEEWLGPLRGALGDLVATYPRAASAAG